MIEGEYLNRRDKGMSETLYLCSYGTAAGGHHPYLSVERIDAMASAAPVAVYAVGSLVERKI